jgi:uncharacterized protein (DUF39 family)
MKTVKEINDKIKSGKAVILTAEEVKEMGRKYEPEEVARKVDVVTTATFGPMCSSGMFVNFGHYNPPIRMEEIYLNDVPVYAGIAAVDAYIGASSESRFDRTYGGAHIIQSLIEGENIHLVARGRGTDCYPTRDVDMMINKDTINEMIMFNPRNAYQNYAVAVNTTAKTRYTYMGTLLPSLGNANYSTSGEISPLLNDPLLRTIGIGTRIFLGGTQGYVSWNGTQCNTVKPRNEHNIPLSNAATLAVIGDAKEMTGKYIQAAYYENYGVSIFIGLGVPIPVLDQSVARAVLVHNRDIETTVVDYGIPDHPILGKVNYEQLQSGEIILMGKKIKTAIMSSIPKAREISDVLKGWILDGKFLLSEMVNPLPEKSDVKTLN